mmetsp:Transcript_66039/g.173084  ORF Transcript_66039/g.173084 Transcript_66039/m.173084 type:complete len:210 (+) Transcript_66039:153-782(+)
MARLAESGRRFGQESTAAKGMSGALMAQTQGALQSRGRRGSEQAAPKPQGLDEEQIEELREAFTLFDTEHTGTIDARELKAALRALAFEINKEDVAKMLKQVGKAAHEHINFDDFKVMMAGRMPNKNTRAEIDKVFSLFDEDGTGKISFRQLKRVSKELGEILTDEELQEMVEEADRDGDGLICPDDFYKVMRKKEGRPLDDWDSDDDM